MNGITAVFTKIHDTRKNCLSKGVVAEMYLFRPKMTTKPKVGKKIGWNKYDRMWAVILITPFSIWRQACPIAHDI